MPLDASAQFYSGFQWVITQNDKHQEILGCYDNNANVNNTFDWLMTYWFERDNMWNAKYVWSEDSEWVGRSLESC